MACLGLGLGLVLELGLVLGSAIQSTMCMVSEVQKTL